MDDLRKLLLGIASVIVVLFLILGIKNCGRQPDFVDDTTIEEASNEASNIESNIDTQENDYEPSTLESQVIAEVNRCRQNPSQYADDVLVPFLNSMHNGNYIFQGRTYTTKEGEDAVIEAISVLRNQEPLIPVEYSEMLHQFATDHCIKQGKSGGVGHNREGNIDILVAAKNFGLDYCGECISYGYNDPTMILVQLLVDDGVPSRGHRNAVINPQFRKLGVACGVHKKYNHMCVLDFDM